MGEGSLLGDRDRKDAGRPGEAPTDELLVSGVWPAKTNTYTHKNRCASGIQCEYFYIFLNDLLCRLLWALVVCCT